MLVFVLVAFLIFTAALMAAAYYAWIVPQQAEAQTVTTRLRELRARGGQRAKSGGDLLKSESTGTVAFLGDFVQWVGVLRRMQEFIDQANLKYRAADVLGLSIVIFAAIYLLLGVLGLSLLLLRILRAREKQLL